MAIRIATEFLTGSKHSVVGVDAGGTSTRAVLVDADGRCLGYGTGPSGNPTSAGADAAAGAIAGAVSAAIASAADSGAGRDVAPPRLVLAAMAGAGLRGGEWLGAALAASGVPIPAEVDADLTAIYLSATLAPVGTALILGTGAIAARVRDTRIERVADGLGWLLGDTGSGFWIGHRVLRRVAEELDGREGPTAMTPAVLARLGIDSGGSGDDEQTDALSRSTRLGALLHEVYARRPVELAAFAPVAFAAASTGDAAARAIVDEAARHAARALITVGAGDGPVVLGGGVLAAQPGLADAVRRALAPTIGQEADVLTASDGVVGAAVLALDRAGLPVDESVRVRIATTLAGLRSSSAPRP